MADISLQQPVSIISNADFIMSEQATPPDNSALWRSVSLTHRWKPDDYIQGNNGWYRLKINLDEIPTERLGIYIRRFNMNAAIFVNDTFLKDGGSFEEPLSRNWNRPLYAPVPALIWKKGENSIYIRLKTYPRYAYISPITIGVDNILSSEYELQRFLQISISTAVFPVTLAVVVFIFSLWVRRRHDTQYLWFSLAVLAWSTYSLNMITVDLWISTKTWEWFAHSSIEWWSILFAIFAHRFINQPHPVLEKIYVAFGVIASLTYFLIEHEDIDKATHLFHGLSIIIGFISTCIVSVSAFKNREKPHFLLAFGFIILLLSAINDWMFQTSISGITGRLTLHFHHYAAPIVFMFMTWHLSGRFSTALNEVELLNIDLKDRVEKARIELEQHFHAAAEIEKTQVKSLERERLSREIHDGMSGNIANSLMLTDLLSKQLEKNDADNSSIKPRLVQLKRQLEEGLTEIRNLMLTMENDVSNLDDLFSYIKDKYQQVLQPQTIFISSFDFANGQQHISQKLGLNILRMTQEVLNNINLHATATEVNLTMKQTEHQLLITITDDGCGFELTEKQKGHYGLSNLQKRGDDLGASVEIVSNTGSGCIVKLDIPL